MAKQSAAVGKGKGKKKTTKEKPELVTPAEFARRLRTAGPSAPRAAATPASQYLQSYVIFYAGGDLTYASARTRGCMSYVRVHRLRRFIFRKIEQSVDT
jgi:hypothetical protein